MPIRAVWEALSFYSGDFIRIKVRMDILSPVRATPHLLPKLQIPICSISAYVYSYALSISRPTQLLGLCAVSNISGYCFSFGISSPMPKLSSQV